MTTGLMMTEAAVAITTAPAKNLGNTTGTATGAMTETTIGATTETTTGAMTETTTGTTTDVDAMIETNA